MRHRSSGRRRHIGFLITVTMLVVTSAAAQDFFQGSGRRGRRSEFVETGNTSYDGRFTFARLRYGGAGAGRGFRREPPWSHDYPRAERNLAKILKELSYIDPYMDGSNIFATDDPELCRFPFAYMSEPGYWTASEEEVEGLRAYLKKGGFLIFDDFRGYDFENFATQVKRVLPEARLVELDATHPIFHSFFEINSLEFVQMYDGGRPVFYGVFEDNDPAKRLMMIVNYNNDIGEYWEFSDTGMVPVDLSNEAYKFGINYVVYAMTH